jgi:hypothetical protein
MLNHLRVLGLAGLVVSATRCDNPFGASCTTEARPAIVVEIRHAATSVPLADYAVAHVTDGAYSEDLRLCGLTATLEGLSRCGAFERAGTYAVLVTAAGYQSWSATGAQVARDRCHVQTVTLQAALQPAP